MPTATKSTATAGPTAAPSPKPPSKSALVLKLLGRTKGATIAEMAEPTAWQPHSTRAFLSGLRKKGMTIARDPRKSGETAYRIITASEAAATQPAALKIAAEAVAVAETGTPVGSTPNEVADAAATAAVASTAEAAA